MSGFIILVLMIIAIFMERPRSKRVDDGLFHEIDFKGLPPKYPWIDLSNHNF